MFLVFICICSFAVVHLTAGEACSSQTVSRIQHCFSIWGYNQNALLGIGYGDMFNFTKMIQFCRAPNSVNLGECMRNATGGCDPNWGEEGRPVWDSQPDLLHIGVNYLCTQQDVLENQLPCLNQVSSRITRCARYVAQQHDDGLMEAHASGNWADVRKQMEGVGRGSEQCIFDVLSEKCSAEVANVFGNFIYGTGTYPFVLENHQSR